MNPSNDHKKLVRLLELGLSKPKARASDKKDELEKLIARAHDAFLEYEAEALDPALPAREIARKAYVAGFVFAALTSGGTLP